MSIDNTKTILNSTDPLKVSYADLPALFRASDQASQKAQKQFVNLTKANLYLLLAAAIPGALAISNSNGKLALIIISAILLTVSTFISIAIKMAKLEQAWYDGRAIAESLKTMSWRYMIGSDPYPISLREQADTLFISAFSSLLSERKAFASRLCCNTGMDQQITAKMRAMRNLSTDERRKSYLSERIDDQRKWYSSKTQTNLKSADIFFTSTIISQALAIISAFILILTPFSLLRFTGVFTTAAAVFLAFTQMRRNDQLAQSYGLAAQELNLIYEQAAGIKTDEDLAKYVVSSENAISREHTMWLARRS